MFSTTYLQSFFYLIQTHAISSQRSQILRRTDTSCLCNIGTRSKPCDVSWLFWVYLYQTIPHKLFQELRIHLSADSYLWSLHLVVNIVKAMFKSIFLSLIMNTLIVKTMLNSWSQLLQNCVKNLWSWTGLLLLQPVGSLDNHFRQFFV